MGDKIIEQPHLRLVDGRDVPLAPDVPTEALATLARLGVESAADIERLTKTVQNYAAGIHKLAAIMVLPPEGDLRECLAETIEVLIEQLDLIDSYTVVEPDTDAEPVTWRETGSGGQSASSLNPGISASDDYEPSLAFQIAINQASAAKDHDPGDDRERCDSDREGDELEDLGGIDEDELDLDTSDDEPSAGYELYASFGSDRDLLEGNDRGDPGPSPATIEAARKRFKANRYANPVGEVRRRLGAGRHGRGNVHDVGLVVILDERGFPIGTRPL